MGLHHVYATTKQEILKNVNFLLGHPVPHSIPVVLLSMKIGGKLVGQLEVILNTFICNSNSALSKFSIKILYFLCI